MGERLLAYYKYISEHGGTAAKTKLAIETKIPSTKAALAPDTTENLRLFEEAITKITGKAPPVLR